MSIPGQHRRACRCLVIRTKPRRLKEQSESELVRACLANDAASQEQLYKRYARRMYVVCLRYARNDLEAQDLLQEGFIRVFDKLNTFRLQGSLEGWIRRIMVTTAINLYRRKSYQLERSGLEHLPDSPVASEALEQLGEKELLALVADLPDGYRLVFNLYAIEGYDHSEIAEQLGIGESTSRSQLAKARKMLQLKINELTLHVATRDTSA